MESGSAGGPWRELIEVVSLPTPLLGSRLEPRQSPDLRSPGLAETHLCLSGTPAQAHPPNITQVHSPPHPGSRTHYLQIFIAPSPSLVASPALDSEVERAGAPSAGRVGVLPPLPSAWSRPPHPPSTQTAPGPLPPPLPPPPQPGVGGGGWGKAGAEASHPQSRAAREVCRGRSAQSLAPAPRLGDAPSPGRGWGVEGMRLCPPGPRKAPLSSRVGGGGARTE